MSGTQHQNIARIATLLLVATAGAAHAQGGAGGFVARATAAPTDRIELSTNQIRTILAAHQPAIVAGTTEDNSATIVLASNGDYVASGTSVVAVGGVIRPATANVVTGTGASSASTGGTGGAGGVAAAGAGGTATAVIVPRDDGQPHFIKIAGIGDIDASLLKDMYLARFQAGEVSVNAISVRIITLKGTAMK